MIKGSKPRRLLWGTVLAGAMLFNVGNCTTNNIKTQMSKGFASTLTGLFNIGSTGLADEVFDVDD